MGDYRADRYSSKHRKKLLARGTRPEQGAQPEAPGRNRKALPAKPGRDAAQIY